MTAIAYDGRTVAADKMATNHGYKFPVTKLRRHGDKVLVFAGNADVGLAMVNWFIDGANPEKYPNNGLDRDDMSWMFVFQRGAPVLVYERLPVPVITDIMPFFAAGSGRDYALGALAHGASAVEAVEIAGRLCISCGLGVDSIDLGEGNAGPD